MYRRSSLSAVTALALALVACSLTALDGFSGGGGTGDDGGAPEAQPLDGPLADAAPDALAAADVGDASPSAYAAAILADRPLAYFRLDDAPGVLALKNEIASSVITLIAPATGATLGVAGIPGGSSALSVDTSDTRVNLGRVDLASPPELFSVEAWIRLDQRGNGGIFSEMDDPGVPATRNGTWLLLDANATLFSEMWLNGSHKLYTSRPSAITFSRFMHVVFLHSDRDYLYVDGVVSTGGIINGGGARATTTATFGFEGFIGALDEIAFYDEPLPADRILAHYAAGLTQ